MPVDPNQLVTLLNGQTVPLLPSQRVSEPIRQQYTSASGVYTYPNIKDANDYLRYGVKIYPHIPADEWRAKNQSRTEQFGNALANTANELVVGTVKGIIDMPRVARTYLDSDGLASLAYEDARNDVFSELYERIKENNPIYKEADEQGFRPDKFTWWAEAMPAAATTASFIIPSIAAAKVATYASKGLGMLAKMGKTGAFIEGGTGLFMGAKGTAAAATMAGALYGNAYETWLSAAQLLPQWREEIVNSEDFRNGKISYDDIEGILEQKASDLYRRNLPNAFLDMLGMYHILKPFGMIPGKIETNIGKRLANTAAFEVIPEGVQEGRNYWAEQKGQRELDKLLGLRSDSQYSITDFFTDPNSWTNMVYGAIGGSMSMGMGRGIKQLGYNLNNQQSFYKGLGKAVLTGLTTPDVETAKKQAETLAGLKSEADKIVKLKNLAELAGDKALYNQLNKRLEVLQAISHVANGTFEDYKAHLGLLGNVLNSIPKDGVDGNNVALHDPVELEELRKNFNQMAATADAVAKQYAKGVEFYGIPLGTKQAANFAILAADFDMIKAELNALLAEQGKLFTQDELGIYRRKRSASLEELVIARTELQGRLDAAADDADVDIALRKAIRRTEEALENYKGDKSTVAAETEILIAKKSLALANTRRELNKILSGADLKEDAERIKMMMEDKPYYDFVYGDGGIKDEIDDAVAKDSIADIIDAATNRILESDEPINIAETVDNLHKEGITVTPENKRKLVDAVDKEVAALQDVKNAAFEAAARELVGDDFYDMQAEVYSPQDILASENKAEADRIEAEFAERQRKLGEIRNSVLTLPLLSTRKKTKKEIINGVLTKKVQKEIDTIQEILDLKDDNPIAVGQAALLEQQMRKYLANDKSEEIDKPALEKLLDSLGALVSEAAELMDKLDKDQDRKQDAKWVSFTTGIEKAMELAIPGYKFTTFKDLQDKLKELKDSGFKVDTKPSVETIKQKLAALLRNEAKNFKPFKDFVQSPESLLYALAIEFNPEHGNMNDAEGKYGITLDPEDIVWKEGALKYAELVSITDDIKKLMAEVKLKRLLKTTQFKPIIQAQNDAKLVPMYKEQLAVFYSFFIEHGAGREYLYMQGVAGTGKTRVVAKNIYSTLIKAGIYKQGEVIAMAKGTEVNNRLNKSLFGKDAEQDLLTAINKQTLVTALKDKKIIFLDEVGKLTAAEFAVVMEAIEEANAGRTEGNRIRLFSFGDPNQMTQFSTIPMLDSIFFKESPATKTAFLPTMNIAQRTNNNNVISFQNRFLRAKTANAFETPFTESHSPDKAHGVAISSKEAFEQDLLRALNQYPGETAILVESEDQKAYYNKFSGLLVYTIAESAGLDFRNIFIDAPTYTSIGQFNNKYRRDNKKLYTAISRATHYVHLKWPVTNGITEKALVEDFTAAERLTKKLAEREGYYNTYLKSELDAFGVAPAKVEEVKTDIEKHEEETGETIVEASTPTVVDPPSNVVIEVDDTKGNKEDAVLSEPLKGVDGKIHPNYDTAKRAFLYDKVLVFRREGRAKGFDDLVYVWQDAETELWHELAVTRTPRIEGVVAAPHRKTYTPDEITKVLETQEVYETTLTYNRPLYYSYNFDNVKDISPAFEDFVKGKIAETFSTTNYIIKPETITTSYFVATFANIDAENKKGGTTKLYNKKDPKAKGDFGVNPGATYMRVEATGVHPDNPADTIVRAQYIPLEPKRLTTESYDIKVLTEMMDSVKNLEGLLEGLEVYWQYGRLATNEVEIKGKARILSESELFMEILKVGGESADKVTTYSNVVEVQEVYEKISAAKNKAEILAAIKRVNDSLVKVVREKSETALTDVYKIDKSENKYAIMQGTGVENATDQPNMLSEELLKLAKSSGYIVAGRNTTYGRPAELRKTFEIGGKNKAGIDVVYHVKVSFPLTLQDDVYTLEPAAAPRIEMFELKATEYDKGGAVRIRPGYKEGVPSNRIYDTSKFHSLLGLSGNAIELLSNTAELEQSIFEAIEEGFPVQSDSKAQQSLNRIARNNNRIYLDKEGTYMSLQREDDYHDHRGKRIKSIGALGLKSATNLNFIYRDTPEGKAVMVGNEFLLEKDVRASKELLKRAAQFELRVLLDELLSFDEQGVSNVNLGFGLRETINTREVMLLNENQATLSEDKKKVVEKVKGQLGSFFEDIAPTEIGFGPATAVAKEAKPVTEAAAAEAPFDSKLAEIAALPESERLVEYFTLFAMLDNEEKKNQVGALIAELTGKAKDNFVDPLADEDAEELNAAYGIPTGSPVANADVASELRKLVPDITDEEIVLATTVITATDAFGNVKEFTDALGLTYQGVIHLLSKDGSVDAQVIRHEAFHKLVNQYLPPHIKAKLLNSLRKHPAIEAHKAVVGRDELTDAEVYNFGAILFQSYDQLPPKTILAKIFKWLVDKIVTPILSFFGRPEAQIRNIFNAINNNKYTERLVPNTGNADFLKRVTRYFPDSSLSESIKDYLVSIDIVKELLQEYTRNAKDIELNAAGEYSNLLYTKVEAVDKILAKIFSETLSRVKKHYGGQLAFTVAGLTNPEAIRAFVQSIKGNDKISAEEKAELIAYVQLQNKFTVQAVIDEIEGQFSSEYLEDLLRTIEDEDVESLEQFEIAAEGAGLADEISQNVHSDQEAKITGKLKQYLSLIPTDKGTYLKFRFAYAKLLDTLVNDTKGLIYGDSFSKFTKLAEETPDKGTKAIYKAIAGLIEESARETYRGYTIPKELLFENGEFNYKWLNVGRSGAQSSPAFYDKIIELMEKQGDEELRTFLTNFPAKLDKYNLLKSIELRGEAADVWGMIVTKMGSQAYNLPVYDSLHYSSYRPRTEENISDAKEIKKTRFRVGRTPLAGVQDNFDRTINSAINRMVLQYAFTNNVGTKFAELKTLFAKDPLKVYIEFGIEKQHLKGLSAAELNSVATNMSTILNAFSANKKGAGKKEGKQEGKLDIDLEDLTSSVSSNISAIAKILAKNNPFLSSLSYRDANGKLRYVFVMGSWVHYVLNRLVNNSLPAFLAHDNHISRNSIFLDQVKDGKKVPSINKIERVVSFDAATTTINGVPNEYGATQIHNMSPADFYQHRFLNGFLGTFLNREINKTYYQYTWQQSDRKSDVAVEIRVLNNKALEQAFLAWQKFNQDQLALESSGAMKTIKNFNTQVKKEWFADMNYSSFLGHLKNMAVEDFKSFLIETDFANPFFTNDPTNYAQLTKTVDALQSAEYELVSDKDIAAVDPTLKEYLGDKYAEKSEVFKKLWKAYMVFYIQNYVNGEFLNQLVFGDKAFTESEDNLVKRMLSIQTPFERQFIGETGNRKTAKYVVAKDFKESFGAIEDFDKSRPKITDAKGHDITDGTTFGIPLTLKNIRKGTRNYHLNNIIKIVRVDTDNNGVRHYNKTALYIIDDELARTQPNLAKIRREMETFGLSEELTQVYDTLWSKLLDGTMTRRERYRYEKLIAENAIEFYFFDSAYKVGAPSDDYQIGNGESIQAKHVFELNNEFMGIQSDPIHDDKSISQTSQFDYFTNINGLNEEEAFLLYSINAELNRLKFDIYSIEANLLDENGKLNKKALAKEIKKAAAKGVSEERLFDLLDGGVDINFPSVEGKSFITVASKVEKNSVGVRHNGKKLVLHTALGVRVYETPNGIRVFSDLTAEEKIKATQFQNLPYGVRQALTKIADLRAAGKHVMDGKEVSMQEYLAAHRDAYAKLFALSGEDMELYNSIVDSLVAGKDEYLLPRRLQIRDREGFTEVIAPRWWARELEAIHGENWPKVKRLYETGMAVRIPTTGIHSAVAIRIIFTAGNTAEGSYRDGVEINRIIAPEELVALHGSDFDVDSLFTMFREVATKDDLGKDDNKQNRESIKVGEHTIHLNRVVGYDLEGNRIEGLEEALQQAAKNAKLPEDKVMYLELLSKLKKNIKIDNNLAIITAKKNQYDMNTPIAFGPLKEDPFDKIKAGMSSKEVAGILSKYLKGAAEDIVSLFPRNLETVLDEAELKKGNLVVKDKQLKAALLDSNIGLISKLKIISKKITLKPDKDINRFTTQMRYHRDNYMGKMGVGIQANLMKAVAYLMYGGRFFIDGKEARLSDIMSLKVDGDKATVVLRNGNTLSGKLERPKVGLVKPVKKGGEFSRKESISFKYKIGDKEYTYDSLERRTLHKGHSTAENGDTRINGYVDNVKVGSTPIVNATSLTIDVIGLMDFTGWEFDDVGYFMNQPIMLLIGSSKLKYNKNVESSLAAINAKFKALTGKEYKDHPLAGETLSREALISVIEKYYGEDIRSVVKDADVTPQDLATQLKVLEYFKDYKEITKSLFSISAVLRLLRSIPTKFEKQYSTRKHINNILAGSMWFESPNFMDIPHIKAAVDAFETSEKIISEGLPINSPEVITLLKDVMVNTSYSNTSKFTEFSEGKTLEMLKDLFRHFLLGKVTETLAGQGFADAYADYVGIELSTGEPVKSEIVTENKIKKQYYQVIKNGKPIKVNGNDKVGRSEVAILDKEEIWAQKFLGEVLDLKKDDAGANSFLNQLVVEFDNDSGLKRMRFTKATGVDFALDAKIKLGFLSLPEEFKRKFVYYSLMVEGASFGQSKYTSYIPVDTETKSLVIDNMKAVSDAYKESIVKEILTKQTESAKEDHRKAKLKNITEMFEYEIMRTQADQVRTVLGKQGIPYPDEKDLAVIFPDEKVRAAKATNYFVMKTSAFLPRWIVRNGKIYVLESVRGISSEESKKVQMYQLYKEVGMQSPGAVMRYNSYYETHSLVDEKQSQESVLELSRAEVALLQVQDRLEKKTSGKRILPPKEVLNYEVKVPGYEGIIYYSLFVETKEVGETVYSKYTYENGKRVQTETTVPVYEVSTTKVFSKTPIESPKYQTAYAGSEIMYKADIEKLAKKLAKTFGVKVAITYSEADWKGRTVGDTFWINSRTATMDTPFHEIGHMFTKAIRKTNPKLVAELEEWLRTSPEGLAMLAAVRRQKLYANDTEQDQIEEAIVELLGKRAANEYTQPFLRRALDTILDMIAYALSAIFGRRLTGNDPIGFASRSMLRSKRIDTTGEERFQGIFNDTVTTDDNSIVYTDANGKTTFRSSFIIEQFDPRLEKRGYKHRKSAEQRAEEDFAAAGLSKDQKYFRTHPNGQVYGSGYTFEEWTKQVEKEMEAPRLRGKAVHYLFAFLRTNEQKWADLALEYQKLADLTDEDMEIYKRMYAEHKKYFPESTFIDYHTERTVTMELPIKLKDMEGNEVTASGISGTPDVVLEHGGNVYSVLDFKTSVGSVHPSLKTVLAKYAKGTNLAFDAHGKNVLKLALNVIAIKYNDPAARFRDINFVVLDKEQGYDVRPAEIATAIKVLEGYFKNEHPEFYAKNKHLFDLNSLRENAISREYNEAKKFNEDLTKSEYIEKRKKELLAQLRTEVARLAGARTRTQTMESVGKAEDQVTQMQIIQKAEAEVSRIVGMLMELDTGFNAIKEGHTEGMNVITAAMTTLYHKKNPIVNYINRMFFEAKQNAEQEIRAFGEKHTELLRNLKKEKNTSGKLVGADYFDFYSFLWDANDKGEYWITTWQSDKWNTLTAAEKAYADFYRWSTRYALFSAMNPKDGISFIQRELDVREDLSAEDRKYLEAQIKELKTLPEWNKFFMAGRGGFSYKEGWTPRVTKRTEEETSTLGVFKRHFTNQFNPTDLDVINAKDTEKEKLSGVPLRYMPYGEEAAKDHPDLYTFNGEVTLASFMGNMFAKKHMDDVYNIGVGIEEYWQEQDKNGTKVNRDNLRFLRHLMDGLIKQQKQDNFKGRFVTLPNGQKIGLDKLISYFRYFLAYGALALNVLGAAVTNTAQGLRALNQATTGTLYKILNPGAPAEYTLKDFAASFAPIAGWFKNRMMNFMGNEEGMRKDKLNFFIEFTTFLPKTYELGKGQEDFLTTRGVVFTGKADRAFAADTLLLPYSLADDAIYASYLTGLLKNITWKDKDGKKWNMWEAYQLGEDGKYHYIAGPRGIDSQTGEEIHGLTTKEIIKMKAFTSRDLGSYRPEERTWLENQTLGALYMTFKRWLPATVQRAFLPEFEDETLGRYMQGEAKDGELPVMTWLTEHNEGFIRTMTKGLALSVLYLKDQQRGSQEFKALSMAQRQNIVYGILRVAIILTLFGILTAIFGDADADDGNKIKASAVRVMQDISFEFIIFNFDQWKRALLSVPSFEKGIDWLSGMWTMIWHSFFPWVIPGLEPAIIEKGPHEGMPKGLSNVLRTTPYVSTGYGFWQLGENWRDLEEDLGRLQ